MISSFLKKVGAAASAAVAASGFPGNVSPAPLVIGSRTVRIRDQLGEGGYAFVYSVEDMNTGEIFALKRMIAGDREQKAIAEQEISIMKQLRDHSHIIQFLGACTKESNSGSRATEYYLLMEMADGGSLIKEIQSKQAIGARYSEREICNIFQQICVALDSLHSQSPPICHRDLKIENILITGSGRQRVYKLCDFGSCTTRAQAYTTKDEILAEEERIQKFSTSMYRAPEMVDLYKRELINEKVDIWAAGCILFTLAYFTQPFQEGGTLQILSGNYEIPENNPYSKYLTSLIRRLLTVQPAKRPDIKFVLKMVELWSHWLKSGGKESVPSILATSASASASSPSSSASLSTSSASSAADGARVRKKSVNGANDSGNSERKSKEKSEEKESKKKKKIKSKESAENRLRMPGAATPPIPSPPPNDDFAADWNPFAQNTHTHAQTQHSNQRSSLAMPVPTATPLSAPSAAHFAPHAAPYGRAPTGPVASPPAHANDTAQPTKVAMLFDLEHMHRTHTPPVAAPSLASNAVTASQQSLSGSSQGSAALPSPQRVTSSSSSSSSSASASASAFQSDEWAKFSPPPQRHTEVEPGEDDWAAFESASFDSVKAMHSQPPAAEPPRSGERSPTAAVRNTSDALAAAPGIFFAQRAVTAPDAAGTASAFSPASKKKLKKVSSSTERATSQ